MVSLQVTGTFPSFESNFRKTESVFFSQKKARSGVLWLVSHLLVVRHQ